MEYIEVSAKTVDDAILEAAIKFGTTREKIAYEVLSQGSAGFLGIGSKKAVIKAHVQTEEELEASKKAEKEVEKASGLCGVPLCFIQGKNELAGLSGHRKIRYDGELRQAQYSGDWQKRGGGLCSGR